MNADGGLQLGTHCINGGWFSIAVLNYQTDPNTISSDNGSLVVWGVKPSNQCQICAVKTMSLSARYSTKFPWQLHNPFCTLAFEYVKLCDWMRLMVANHDYKVYKMSCSRIFHGKHWWTISISNGLVYFLGLLYHQKRGYPGDIDVSDGRLSDGPYRSPSSSSSDPCFASSMTCGIWIKCKDLAKNWAKRGETMYFFPGEEQQTCCLERFLGGWVWSM